MHTPLKQAAASVAEGASDLLLTADAATAGMFEEGAEVQQTVMWRRRRRGKTHVYACTGVASAEYDRGTGARGSQAGKDHSPTNH